MKYLILIILFSNVMAYEVHEVDDMVIEMPVKDIVRAICKKTPFVKTSRCVKKKLKCINKDYAHGAELEDAIFDCF